MVQSTSCNIQIKLPFPPSVNGLYAGKKIRYKSAPYKAWIIRAKTCLLNQNYKSITNEIPLQVTYTFGRPDKRIRDVENYAKAISDLLVSEHIIPDDSLIERMILEWKLGVIGATIEISPL